MEPNVVVMTRDNAAEIVALINTYAPQSKVLTTLEGQPGSEPESRVWALAKYDGMDVKLAVPGKDALIHEFWIVQAEVNIVVTFSDECVKLEWQQQGRTFAVTYFR